MPNLPRNAALGSNINRSGVAGDKNWEEATETWDESDPHTWDDYKNPGTDFTINSTATPRAAAGPSSNVTREAAAAGDNVDRQPPSSGINITRN